MPKVRANLEALAAHYCESSSDDGDDLAPVAWCLDPNGFVLKRKAAGGGGGGEDGGA
jgi:hypothetical protein